MSSNNQTGRTYSHGINPEDREAALLADVLEELRRTNELLEELTDQEVHQ
jgi:hypothetical protein